MKPAVRPFTAVRVCVRSLTSVLSLESSVFETCAAAFLDSCVLAMNFANDFLFFEKNTQSFYLDAGNGVVARVRYAGCGVAERFGSLSFVRKQGSSLVVAILRHRRVRDAEFARYVALCEPLLGEGAREFATYRGDDIERFDLLLEFHGLVRANSRGLKRYREICCSLSAKRSMDESTRTVSRLIVVWCATEIFTI